MSDNTIETEDGVRPPLLSGEELVSIVTFGFATLFAAVAIACRWFVDYQGQGLRLLLIAGSATAAMLLISRSKTNNLIEKTGLYAFAVVAVIALISWSPDFAFALMVTAPIVLTLTIPILLRWLGYDVRLQARNGSLQNESLQNTESPNTSPLMTSPSTTRPGNGQAVSTETNLADQTPHENSELDVKDDVAEQPEIDPWSIVQSQFNVDATLAQNVARWEEADGTSCVVASLRCHFSTPDETCIVHLPFWPILETVPTVICRVASGPAANIKTTQEHPHGLRVEVRLNDRSALPTDDVIVEIVASVPGAGATDVAA